MQNLKGQNELDAKVRYVHKCRSLKTYGVTFYIVKEKMKGKNKLVPRLLGVNKDCVMRVDEKTKEVMKVWPLEQVRRWAASPNTFTLDFGDYQVPPSSSPPSSSDPFLSIYRTPTTPCKRWTGRR